MGGTLKLSNKQNDAEKEFEKFIRLWKFRLDPEWQNISKEAKDLFVEWLDNDT